jgi:hypothetical protein
MKEFTYSPSIDLGFVYLSGDDPDSDAVEAFDPLFSRWPWMSELLILTYAREIGTVAYWNNLSMLRASVGLGITPQLSANVTLNIMSANYKCASSITSNNGLDRGILPQLRVNYKFSDTLSCYALYEQLMPGNFYKDGSTEASFFRFNVDLKIL